VREDAVLTRILTTTLINKIVKALGLPSTQRLRRIVASLIGRAIRWFTAFASDLDCPAHAVLKSSMAVPLARDPGQV
jgi:hypothetical protein